MNPDFIDRARLGDSRALHALSICLRPRIARMAAYYARRCQEEADDLQQEAWLGVLEALPRLDIRVGNPEQSLLQYARWRLLDAVRRSLSRDMPVELSDSIRCECKGPEVLDGLNIAAFLKHLTPIQRHIVLCLLAGLTWRETGDALGCTSANVAYPVRRIGAQYRAFCDVHPALV